MKINVPSTDFLDANGQITKPWIAYLEQMSATVARLTRVGTTAQRPVRGDGLEIGDPYYDTTLGYGIWCAQVTPAVVWHNAVGAPV